MKRQYRALRVTASKGYLSVHFYVEVGATIRFAEVKVPWPLVVEQAEPIMNAIELHYTETLKARWEQDTLPLEKWE